MMRIIGVVVIGLALGQLLAAGEPPVVGKERFEEVRQLAEPLFGREVTAVAPIAMPERVVEFCPGWQFFRVQLAQDAEREHLPDIGPPRMLAAKGELTARLDGFTHVVQFVSDLRSPVRDELDALQLCMAAVELFRSSVCTRMPERQSIINTYKTQWPEDWPIVIAADGDGWRVALTALIDKDIEFYRRYRLTVSRDGQLHVTAQLAVYSYTAYE